MSTEVTGKKICTKCKEEQPTSNFDQRKDGGYFAQCRKCFTRHKSAAAEQVEAPGVPTKSQPVDNAKSGYEVIVKKLSKLIEAYNAKDKQKANKQLLSILAAHIELMSA